MTQSMSKACLQQETAVTRYGLEALVTCYHTLILKSGLKTTHGSVESGITTGRDGAQLPAGKDSIS